MIALKINKLKKKTYLIRLKVILILIIDKCILRLNLGLII